MRTLTIIIEKDVGTVLFFNSLVYTASYTITSTIPSLFAEIYGFNDLQIGESSIFIARNGFTPSTISIYAP